MQLALYKVVGQMAHCIGPQRTDVAELASLLPSQGSYPFNDIIGDLHQPCQDCYMQQLPMNEVLQATSYNN